MGHKKERKLNNKRGRKERQWEMDGQTKRKRDVKCNGGEKGDEVIRGAEREGEGDYGRKKDGCCDKDGG